MRDTILRKRETSCRVSKVGARRISLNCLAAEGRMRMRTIKRRGKEINLT